MNSSSTKRISIRSFALLMAPWAHDIVHQRLDQPEPILLHRNRSAAVGAAAAVRRAGDLGMGTAIRAVPGLVGKWLRALLTGGSRGYPHQSVNDAGFYRGW